MGQRPGQELGVGSGADLREPGDCPLGRIGRGDGAPVVVGAGLPGGCAGDRPDQRCRIVEICGRLRVVAQTREPTNACSRTAAATASARIPT
jgi:hypothetical protein